ncbi:MAG: glycosyltransferase [Alphaproteobacteria bacterium]|nr:glycosyltransferase [Alphaproteobacteria bacterium]
MTARQIKHVIVVNDRGVVQGGQAKVAVETALMLAEHGLEVSFLVGSGRVDSRLAQAGVRCEVVDEFAALDDPQRLKAMGRGIWNRGAAHALARMLNAADPATSIVHVHGFAKALSPAIGPVLSSSEVPHVFTMHEYFLACPNGGFFDYPANEICTRRAMGPSCLTANCDSRSAVHKAWRLARHAVLKTAGHMPSNLKDIIYLSEIQLEVMAPYLPKVARLHAVPNLVSPYCGQRAQAETNSGFLFVGRLSPEKGGALVAQAAGQAGVEIAFAGEGSEAERIRKINPDAKLLGWLSSEQLTTALSSARCLVFPSLWYETFGLSVAEAQQRGLPTLVSDRTSAAEFVSHDVNGLHVRSGSVDDWVTAMRAMSDDSRVKRYSEAAFSGADRFLDREGYLDRLLAVYSTAHTYQRVAA